MEDWKTIRTLSREDMMKRVARFRKLKGSDGGLPDSPLPECRRKLYAVIGFQPPMSDSSAVTLPSAAMRLRCRRSRSRKASTWATARQDRARGR
jgi:hypothetical protein